MPTDITVAVAPRVFRAGALEIVDPNPALSVDESWETLKDNYPHLVNAQLSHPTLENGRMVVSVETPPIKLNG